uniref:Uncharacterized protein n=1 Tax=Arundo donax TaxID=35708 RepID=A0A0A8ZRA4_ARUDO
MQDASTVVFNFRLKIGYFFLLRSNYT